jgi:hypothetical protein
VEKITVTADYTEVRASKAARFGNSGPRHSSTEPEELENIDLRGSFIEKKFRSFSAAGAEWYRGQLIHPIRGGNFWMVSLRYIYIYIYIYLNLHFNLNFYEPGTIVEW